MQSESVPDEQQVGRYLVADSCFPLFLGPSSPSPRMYSETSQMIASGERLEAIHRRVSEMLEEEPTFPTSLFWKR